jgi:sugar phosphate permease
MSESTKPKYWFRAKTHGCGWGAPACWQGWVVLIGTLIPAITLPFLLAPMGDIGLCLMVPCETVLIAGLVITFSLKGEPVGWRWGNKEQDNHEESNKPSDATR